MKKLISVNLAGKILIIALILLLVFHVLVITGILPSSMVWGGQIEGSAPDIITLELIAIVVSLLFLVIVIAKIKAINSKGLRILINISLWFMFVYFTLNILGNITSLDTAEKMIFTPLSIIMALCALRLALEK
jgi:hypothetical protein